MEKYARTDDYKIDNVPPYLPQFVTEQPKSINAQPLFGPIPVRGITCPVCSSKQGSVVKHQAGSMTHTFGVLLCCVAPGCCCLPYCIDSCRNANHYCSNCNSYLGTYKS